MEKDTAGNHGLKMMEHRIAHHTGHHLTWEFVSEVMHKHDSKGFKWRNPTARKIHRTPKVPIGIHERWAGDGDDKLYGIGFPIWAVVDDVTGRWLDGWVVPSNCMGAIIGYLFLCLVEKYGGSSSFKLYWMCSDDENLKVFHYNFPLTVVWKPPSYTD